MEIIAIVVAGVLGLGIGAGGIFAYNKKKENGGKNKADDLIRKAKHEAGDIVLDDIFESFTVPGEITKEQLATLVTYKVDPTTQEQTTEIESQFTITVTAQAIQADGFDDAEAAWTAWVD